MTQIEEYQHSSGGYNPFLIRDGWQVAQLNYDESSKIDNISRLDIHYKTDEAFVLLKGKAILIGATINDDAIEYDIKDMQANITYNIPALMWHSIVLSRDAFVLIVEKDNTHLGDYEFYNFSEAQTRDLHDRVKAIQKEKWNG